MQTNGGRTRRQTRQSAAAAAAQANAATNDPAIAIGRYQPGATLGPSTGGVTTRGAQGARPTRRVATRGATKLEQEARQAADKARSNFEKTLAILVATKLIDPEERDHLMSGAQNVEGEGLMKYLEESIGVERLRKLKATAAEKTRRNQQLQNQRAQTAMIQQSGFGAPGGVHTPGTYSMQQLVNQYTLSPAHQMPGHGLSQQPVRPLSYSQGLAQQMNQRTGQQTFQQDAMGYPIAQRPMPGTGGLQNMRGTGQVPATGEVAKTLMPSRSDNQSMQYQTGHILQNSGSQIGGQRVGGDFSRQQLPSESRPASESVSNKRMASGPAENTSSKAARYSKGRRTVEDPSAPDVGDMDVVTEADIRIGEEQEALLNDVPSESVVDVDGQIIESSVLNVQAVKLKLQQVLREQGMQLAASEGIDIVIQGMEEKFEALILKAIKRAMHRCETGHITSDSETVRVTSDVRTKLREVKKKQEQYKANKLREEKEKLEQLAETASKKELANNKELAAKVEKVKREKQFNAEAEAANRALSNALGGFGFEKYRKMKKDKEAREAAAAAGRPAAAPRPPPKPPTAAPVTSVPPPASPPVSQERPATEKKRQVVVRVKDVLSVMEQDNQYGFSPILYRLHLTPRQK